MRLAPPQLTGDPVQARGPSDVLGQRQIENGSADAPVSVFEWMDGFKPQVGHARTHETVFGTGSGVVEPLQEGMHFGRYCGGRGCHIVDMLLPHGPAHDLHGVFMGAKAARLDVAQCRPFCREQCGLPTAQPFLGEIGIPISRRVLHDIQQTLDVSGNRCHEVSRDAEAAGDRGTDAGQVEDFTLNGSGRDRLARPDLSFHVCQVGRADCFGLAA